MNLFSEKTTILEHIYCDSTNNGILPHLKSTIKNLKLKLKEYNTKLKNLIYEGVGKYNNRYFWYIEVVHNRTELKCVHILTRQNKYDKYDTDTTHFTCAVLIGEQCKVSLNYKWYLGRRYKKFITETRNANNETLLSLCKHIDTLICEERDSYYEQ